MALLIDFLQSPTSELIFCCGNNRSGNFVLTWRRSKLLELQPPRRHNKAKSTLASQPILANSKPVRLEDCQVLAGLRSHGVMLRCSCGQCRRRGLAEYNSFLQGMLHGSIGSSEAYRSSRDLLCIISHPGLKATCSACVRHTLHHRRTEPHLDLLQ